MKEVKNFNIQIQTTGNYTDDELKDYIEFVLGSSALDNDNPFITNVAEAEITDVTVY